MVCIQGIRCGFLVIPQVVPCSLVPEIYIRLNTKNGLGSTLFCMQFASICENSLSTVHGMCFHVHWTCWLHDLWIRSLWIDKTKTAQEILARVILRSGVPWGLIVSKMLNFSQLSLAMIWSRIVLDTEFHGDLHSVFFKYATLHCNSQKPAH